jgi:dTDP-4-dehydrorhamnose 3,5-epimerase-like enzyme
MFEELLGATSKSNLDAPTHPTPLLFEINLFQDDRGEFVKHFPANSQYLPEFQAKQVNRCTNMSKGTLRGMHFQTDPW